MERDITNTYSISFYIDKVNANYAGITRSSIFDKGVGDTFVAVVLGSSYKERFDDMQKIVSVVTKY